MTYPVGSLHGVQLGNYRLLRVLGRGGFAEVYLGQHVYLNTYAALKVLHVQLTHGHVQEFLNEARMIAHLEHPGIVRVLEFGVHEGRPFLVMPYAAYGNARTYHPKGTVLPKSTLISYIRQVADALFYAHECKVIHRDIKPENMLLGPRRELLLSDFGIAVLAPTISSHQELRKVAGTITYMAPEQMQGKPCTASDQYALGVVIYEWLCGTPPFTGSYTEIAMQHLTADVPSLREKVPALAPAVERVVLKALAKKPGQRFESVAAFADALEQILCSEQEEAVHQSSPVKTESPDLPVQTIGRLQQRPLVGREQELRSLRQFIFATEQRRATVDGRSISASSRSSWIVLLGEAGIGKTRLAEEAGREALQRGWAVMLSRAYPQECAFAYSIWIEALRQVLSQVRGLEETVTLHPQRYLPLMALMPELKAWFSKGTMLLSGSRDLDQQRLWEAMFALLVTASECQPVLLMFDDLQWIDRSSSAFLGYLARRVSNHRLLVLGTLRQGELLSTDPLQTLLADLRRERITTILPLQRLTDTQISTLVAGVPPALISHIQQQSAGNPFFAEELARSIGVQFIQADQLYRLPHTISALLDLRIRTLSNACQRLLVEAAVLGGSFALHTLRAMGVNTTATEEDTFLDLIEEARQAGILAEEGAGANITYHFWHPLQVCHLYDNLSAGSRAALHRRAAQVLRSTSQGREEEEAAAITYHLLNGGAASSQVARYAELAGDRAYTLSAYPEAARHYYLALEHTDVLSASSGTDKCLHLAYLLERLGECMRVLCNYEEAYSYFKQALEARNQYRQMAVQLDGQYETQIDALLWLEIAKTWFDRCNSERAMQSCDYAEQLLREAHVHMGAVWANLYLFRSYVYWQHGYLEQAHRSAHQALVIFESTYQRQDHPTMNVFQSTASRRILAGDPVDLGRAHLLSGTIAGVMGQSATALHHQITALAIFERYERQREIAIVCGNIGDLYLQQAKYADARAHLRRSLAIAEKIGEISIESTASGNLGTIALRLGSIEEAERYFRRGLALAEQARDLFCISFWNNCLATVLQNQGKFGDAISSLLTSIKVGRSIRFIRSTSSVLVNLAQLRIAQALRMQIDRNYVLLTRERRNLPKHLLHRARNTLQHALSLEGLDSETRTEALLVLARVLFLKGDATDAQRIARQALEEATHYEHIWLLACIQRLLGNILAAKGQHEESVTYFLLSLQILEERGMRLEWARTLHNYHETVLQRVRSDDDNYQQELAHLREARRVFEDCGGILDLELIDHSLAMYVTPIQAAAHQYDSASLNNA